jgi:hypothetical protein
MSTRGFEKVVWPPWENIESAKRGESNGRIHVENLTYMLMDKEERKAYQKILSSDLNPDLFYDADEQPLSVDYDDKVKIMLHELKNRSGLTPYVLAYLIKTATSGFGDKSKLEMTPNAIAAILGRHESTARTMTRVHTWGEVLNVPFELSEHGSGVLPDDILAYSSTDRKRHKDKGAHKTIEAYLQKFETRMAMVDKKSVSALKRIKKQIDDRIPMLLDSGLISEERASAKAGKTTPRRLHVVGKERLKEAYHKTMPDAILLDEFPVSMEFLGDDCPLSGRRKRHLMTRWSGDVLKNISVVEVPYYLHKYNFEGKDYRDYIKGMLVEGKVTELGPLMTGKVLVGKKIGEIDINDPELPFKPIEELV